MKRLLTSALSIIALACAVTPSFSEDNVAMAEKLLQGAFACPAPPSIEYECDTPVTSISRSSFSGDRTAFRVATEIKIISSNFCDVPPDEAGRELHRHIIMSGNYGDISRSAIESYQVPMGDHMRVQKKLTLYCRSGQNCIGNQMQEDFGEDRTEDKQYDKDSFEFCNEEELQNAKVAFDTLIAAAPKTQPQETTRRVKSLVSGGYINLREGPGLDQRVVVEIPAGESIVVDESDCKPGSDGRTKYPFCRVTWEGHVGWASASGYE